jgi:RimJ/RimL family protein N-acetyltransferase
MCSALIPPVIRTARLSLRAPMAADAPRLALLCADFDITRMTSRMPWPYGLSEARAFIETTASQDRARENTFLIEHEEDGVVGCIGLFTPRRVPEIGYWIGRPYWGRGFATEATTAALDWAREDWRKKVVVAGHFADNPASGAVLCKTGFLYTGLVEMRESLARQAAAPTRMMVWLA